MSASTATLKLINSAMSVDQKSLISKQFAKGCIVPLLTWQLPTSSPWYAELDPSRRTLTKAFPPVDKTLSRSYLTAENLEPGAVYYIELSYTNLRSYCMLFDAVQVGVYVAAAPDPFSNCFTHLQDGWGLSCSNGHLRHGSVEVKFTDPLNSRDLIGLEVDMVLGSLSFFVNGCSRGAPWMIPELSSQAVKVAVALVEFRSQVTLYNKESVRWRSRRSWLFVRKTSKVLWLKQLSNNLAREVTSFI